MRWLGVDLGARRVGLALSEDDEGPGMPLPALTIPAGGEVAAVLSAIDAHRAEALVVGLPLEMSGREGLAAKRARGIAERIAAARKVAIVFLDERLTTREAAAQLKASNRRGAAAKSAVDGIAAKILLDTHLASRARERGR